MKNPIDRARLLFFSKKSEEDKKKINKEILKFLYLDLKSRDQLIESNSFFQKHFLDLHSKKQKRKPRRLNSVLAKKLENPRLKLVTKYENLKDDFNNIYEIEIFDEIRQLEFMAQYERIQKIRDVVQQNLKLGELYSQIRSEIEGYLGYEEKKSHFSEETPLEVQLEQSRILGSKHFQK